MNMRDDQLEPQGTDEWRQVQDRDLAERIYSLQEEPHASSECSRSSRPIVVEALIWMAVGVVIWIGVAIALA